MRYLSWASKSNKIDIWLSQHGRDAGWLFGDSVLAYTTELCKVCIGSRNFFLYRFKDFFEQKGMLKNCNVRSHSNDPLRLIQVKGKRVSIHILPKAEEIIRGLIEIGHIVKLGKCTDYCFVLPTFISAKRDGSVKLALNSKLIQKTNLPQLSPIFHFQKIGGYCCIS